MQTDYTWQLRYGNMIGDKILKLITIPNLEGRMLRQVMVFKKTDHLLMNVGRTGELKHCIK
jgi:hypothetical protein